MRTMDKRKYWIFSVVFALALVADQVTKVWARATLKPLGHAIVVVQDYFDFRYSENPGSAFGLLRDVAYGRWILLAFGIVALGVIGYFLLKLRPDKGRIAAELGLLAGGAIGNIVDRVMYGKVTDFVLWKVHTHEWPIFNVADAALVVGVLALLIDARGEEMDPPPAAKA